MFERRSADQGTIDVGLRKEFQCIVCLDTSPVENDYLLGSLVGKQIGKECSDAMVDFFGLSRRGSLAGSNGPNRFVSQNGLEHLFVAESFK